MVVSAAYRLAQLRTHAESAPHHDGKNRSSPSTRQCFSLIAAHIDPQERFLIAFCNAKIIEDIILSVDGAPQADDQASVRFLIESVGSQLFGDGAGDDSEMSQASPQSEWTDAKGCIASLVYQCCEQLQSRVAQNDNTLQASDTVDGSAPVSVVDRDRALLADVVQAFMGRCVRAATRAVASSPAAAELVLRTSLATALPSMDALLAQFARGERPRSGWWKTFFDNVKLRWLRGLLMCVASVSSASSGAATAAPESCLSAAIIIAGCFLLYVQNAPEVGGVQMNLFTALTQPARQHRLWSGFINSSGGGIEQHTTDLRLEDVVRCIMAAPANATPLPFPQLASVATPVFAAAKYLDHRLRALPDQEEAMESLTLAALSKLKHNNGGDLSPFGHDLRVAVTAAIVQSIARLGPAGHFEAALRIIESGSNRSPPLADLEQWPDDALFVAGYMAACCLHTELLNNIVAVLQCDPQRAAFAGPLQRIGAQVRFLAGTEKPSGAFAGSHDASATTSWPHRKEPLHSWVRSAHCVSELIDASLSSQHRPGTEATAELAVSLVAQLAPNPNPEVDSLGTFSALFSDSLCAIAWCKLVFAKQPGWLDEPSATVLEHSTCSSPMLLAMNARTLLHTVGNLRVNDISDGPIFNWAILSLFEATKCSVVPIPWWAGTGVKETSVTALCFLSTVFNKYPDLRTRRFGVELWKRAALDEITNAAVSRSRTRDVWASVVCAMPATEQLRNYFASLCSPASPPTVRELHRHVMEFKE